MVCYAELLYFRIIKKLICTLSLQLNQDYPLLVWLSRFLTGLCAPGFMFIMGIGIVYFRESRKKLAWSEQRIWMHFATRGALLVALNFLQFINYLAAKKFLFLTVLYALV